MSALSPKRSKTTKKVGYVNGIYLGDQDEVYELHRHAAVSGAGSPSALIRIWNNKAKTTYAKHRTLLERDIISQAQFGNNEIPGLLEELKKVHRNLSAGHLQLALNSLVRRLILIEAHRGGKTEKARGAKTRCYFPYGHKLGSEYRVSAPGSNYEGGDDE